MEALLTVSLKVGIMIVMIAVGWIITKKNILTDKGSEEITAILLKIVTPCLIISSFVTADPGDISPSSLVLSAVLSAAALLVAILVSFLFFRKSPAGEKTVLRFGIIFSNAGFMGMPLVQSIVGEQGVIYGSFFIATFNLICWTYGYSLMSGGGKIKLKSVLFNPGTIGLAVGLPIYILRMNFPGFALPELIGAPIQGFADLNTPLAMVVVGANIAKVKVTDFLTDRRVYVASFGRLILAPVILIALMCLVKPESDLFISTMVQAAAPTAANCVLFAVMLDQDSLLASKLVAGSTLMSIVTIPLMTVLSQMAASAVL